MELVLPGLCFATSSVPLKFDTDGTATLLQPLTKAEFDPEHILVLTRIHAHLFDLQSVRGVSLMDSVEVPHGFMLPEVYDGTQELSGKRVLLLALNGWGDMILVQPALHAFCESVLGSNNNSRITLACNWIDNFPYRDSSYFRDIRPNIMTLKDFAEFDVFVNLIPVNYQRSLHRSMKDIYMQMLKLNGKAGENSLPSIKADPERVANIRPILDEIRESTGKRLLCVNWRSRFPHKNASSSLFFEVVNELSGKYQAVIFKDAENAQIMQAEIDNRGAAVKDLSHIISDYHDTVAALSLVEAFISVDTGIVHAGGAMGIPGVALFGPFPPETHVADYPSIIGIRASYEGRNCNGPCLETHRGCREVDFSPAEESPCFQALTVESVIEAFDSATEGKCLPCFS